jgi:hypothetical protein
MNTWKQGRVKTKFALLVTPPILTCSFPAMRLTTSDLETDSGRQPVRVAPGFGSQD